MLISLLGTSLYAEEVSTEQEKITSAKSALLMDYKTGRVLFEENGYERLAQASTTKIMTALLALEEPELDEYFKVDNDAICIEGSTMGLVKDDMVSLRQLVYGMILPSGNDAANVTAVKLAGSTQAFAELMNERAFQLGLNDTHFKNPSGLDEDGHFTTAYDLAKLTRYALGYDEFREICSLSSAETCFGNPPYNRWLNNHNKLLELYDKCIGVKTGFTDNAGRVLSSAAEDDGIRLICITMNDRDDWYDHEMLYEKYFDMLELTDISPLINETEVRVAGSQERLSASVEEDLNIPLFDGEYEQLKAVYVMMPFVYAPISKGDSAGRVDIYSGQELLTSFPLVFTEGIEAEEKGESLFEKFSPQNIIEKLKTLV